MRPVYNFLLTFLVLSCSNVQIKPYFAETSGPIYPDYRDVIIPSDIAPLNFIYTNQVPSYTKTTFSCGNVSCTVKGRKVCIGKSKWKKLLSVADESEITVKSEALDTVWKMYLSDDDIDYGLNYRLIEPGYQSYSRMGIYERQLANYEQSSIFDMSEVTGGCCNCHSHCQGDPGFMSLHIRGDYPCGLILIDGGMKAYNTKSDSTFLPCGHTSWHPSANYICYSASQPAQVFISSWKQIIEVFEKFGNIVVYDIKRNELILSPLIFNDKFVDSFPAFSSDGDNIYFTRKVSKIEQTDFRDVKCSLCRIGFDAETGTIGDSVKVVIDTSDIGGGSVCFPKPSPDGRYIIFARADYGIFASWHHESDLWLYDMETGALRPIDEVNSADSESTPCWSTNGRWIAFGSRRDDGLFTRIYIAHFDPETGRFGKPFMLPQRDPEEYYASLFFSYNIPEFVTGPAVFDHRKARKLIMNGNDSGPKRIQFGVRRQGRPGDYDAVTGSSVSGTDGIPTDASSGASAEMGK